MFLASVSRPNLLCDEIGLIETRKTNTPTTKPRQHNLQHRSLPPPLQQPLQRLRRLQHRRVLLYQRRPLLSTPLFRLGHLPPRRLARSRCRALYRPPPLPPTHHLPALLPAQRPRRSVCRRHLRLHSRARVARHWRKLH